jgi:hypothetical protein
MVAANSASPMPRWRMAVRRFLCVKTASRGDTILFKIAMSKNLENWSRMKKMSQMRHFAGVAITLEGLGANTEAALARARLAQFVANQSGS